VKEELGRAREELARSIAALRQEITLRFDWHTWVERRPEVCLAIAFAVGFWLGRR
jgi:hypothetical protein